MSRKYMVLTASSLKKRPGWFSWRHKTREACDAAREEWIAAHPHSVAGRKRRAL